MIEKDFYVGEKVVAFNAKFGYSINVVIEDVLDIGAQIYYRVKEIGKDSDGFWIKQYPNPYGWILKRA